MSKKLTYNNVKYKSVFEFYNLNQEDIDVTYEELLKNIRNNIPIDLAIKKQPRKKTASKHGPYIVEGEEYLNMPDLAKEYGINPNTIYKRYERGKRGDDLIPLNKRKKYIKPINAKKYRYYIQGKGFNSKSEMCEYFGIKD
jgi:DNA-binding transcriptional regulator YhcF (GntR family)